MSKQMTHEHCRYALQQWCNDNQAMQQRLKDLNWFVIILKEINISFYNHAADSFLVTAFLAATRLSICAALAGIASQHEKYFKQCISSCSDHRHNSQVYHRNNLQRIPSLQLSSPANGSVYHCSVYRTPSPVIGIINFSLHRLNFTPLIKGTENTSGRAVRQQPPLILTPSRWSTFIPAARALSIAATSPLWTATLRGPGADVDYK